MFYRAIPLPLLLCTLVGTSALGQPVDPPLPVAALIQRADPRAKVEYCGAVSTKRVDYYLFILQQNELSGMALVRQEVGMVPVIVDADTSLLPFNEDSEPSLERPVQDAIELLLERRIHAKRVQAPQRTSKLDPEVSAIGREIDRVIYPISGFSLGSNSTHEILRLLRTGPTLAVDPENAPPGSIIVSPTRSSPSGRIYLGHAGIVGSNASIDSADARYAGAWTKNFSLTSWARKFSGTNGSYAFVIHAPADKNLQGR